MKRLGPFFLSLILLNSLTSVTSAAAPKHASNLKRVGHQAEFPLRHPLATIEGIAFEVVTYVGAAVDLVERGTAIAHAGASKVDEAIDKIEDKVKGQAPPVSPAIPENQTLQIPGCSPEARAFVPKGCYPQSLENLAEVRCPKETFKFRCLATP